MSERTMDFNSTQFDDMAEEMAKARLFRTQILQVLMVMLPISGVYVVLHFLFYGALILPVFYSGLMVVIGVFLIIVLIFWNTKRLRVTGSCYDDKYFEVFLFTMAYLIDFVFIHYGINFLAASANTLSGSALFWVGVTLGVFANIGLAIILVAEGTWDLHEMTLYIERTMRDNLVEFVKSDKVYEKIYEKYYDAILI